MNTLFVSIVEEPTEPVFQTPALAWDALEDAPSLGVFDSLYTADGISLSSRWLLPQNIVIFNSLDLVTQQFFFSNEVTLLRYFLATPEVLSLSADFFPNVKFTSLVYFYFI